MDNVNGFDYKHQAWVKDELYIRCGHPESMPCGCYGRTHQGEHVSSDIAYQIEAHNRENERFIDPAYLKAEKAVARSERSIRRSSGYRN